MFQEVVSVPRVGMLATLRKRRGVVSSVDPYPGADGKVLHLVRVEYTDISGGPEDVVLWELEPGASLVEPTALPRVADEPPMRAQDYDALVRAARWGALTPFLPADGSSSESQLPIASPFFGAVQAEDFQLVPLLQALRMPRVSLLLADDVGLGKTVEAGLILTELLLRRRVRRVLILCPASLRVQWQQEMRDKFSLTFDVVDRPQTHALQKRLGLDANPWRTFPRIVSSYHYLKQPDVLEQFLSVCRSQPPGAAQLPWDLLVVDEAHNCAPASFGDDSDLCKALRLLAPWFEHKLFLTATPHNGHTRSFSGLLELLDPVRFTQTSEFGPRERERAEEVVVRRLKSEINELDESRGRPRRFAERHLKPEPLYFGSREAKLSRAFQAFRKAVKAAVAASRRSEQLAGSFAVEVLNKRLLSSPYSFAESWHRFREGLEQEETADAAEVTAAHRLAEEDIDDDLEREGRAHHTARTVGAWLKPLAPKLAAEVAAVDAGLSALGLGGREEGVLLGDPAEDVRLERLFGVIQDRLREGDRWSADERLVVFTEYKTTLDYLERRLREAFKDHGSAVRVLYGGMDDPEREGIKAAFNDPTDPVRVLVATDAASEGLNLQETARLVLHYDVPWNPARMEQRNGRLDRHGQARDVTVYHFTSEDDADLRFLAHVVAKVHTIREDLGSTGEVFDAAFQRRFTDLDDVEGITADLDSAVEEARGRAQVPTRPRETGVAEAEGLARLCRTVDLSPASLRETLEVALGVGVGGQRLEGPDDRNRVGLKVPLPPRWEALVDDTLRLPAGRGQTGPLPALVFDPKLFIQENLGRPVFRPAKDAVLLHLGHPVFRHALATLSRARFPGGHDGLRASRWAVRRGPVSAGADALLLLTVEELAVNELREPFHHWVRTLRLPVRAGELGEPLPEVAAADDLVSVHTADDRARARAQTLWDEIGPQVAALMKCLVRDRTAQVQERLKATRKKAHEEQRDLFKERVTEVERAVRDTTLKRLEKELGSIEDERRKLHMRPSLFAEMEAERLGRIRDIDRRAAELEEELERRRKHYGDLLERLRAEQERVLERLVPRRHELRGQVQVFPVGVEVRFPEVAR